MSNDDTTLIVGAIPTLSASFAEKNEGLSESDTELAQQPAESERRKSDVPASQERSEALNCERTLR